MRLIDADELKKAFDKLLDETDEYEFYPEMVEELIDNAPTVDTDEIYKKGYHNGFFATHDVPRQ